MAFNLVFVQPLPAGECLLINAVVVPEAPIPVEKTDLAPLVRVFYKRLAAALEAWKLDLAGPEMLKNLRTAGVLHEDALSKLKGIQYLFEEDNEDWENFKDHLKAQGVLDLELDAYSLVEASSMETLAP